jgi:hypothetical protein
MTRRGVGPSSQAASTEDRDKRSAGRAEQRVGRLEDDDKDEDAILHIPPYVGVCAVRIGAPPVVVN